MAAFLSRLQQPLRGGLRQVSWVGRVLEQRIEREDVWCTRPAPRTRRGRLTRWKQRALYDTMRDVIAAHGAVRMARLAVYDDVGGVSLGRALDRPSLLDQDALRSLLTERTLAV